MYEGFIGIKDELHYPQRYDLMQNLRKETITSRSELSETALRVRNNVNARLDENTGTIGAFAYRAAEGMITYLKTGGLLTELKHAKKV